MAQTSSKKIAGIICDIFSPLLVPTYGMVLAMWITPLRALPEGNRLMATFLVAILTGLVPLSTLLALRRAGRVGDMAVSQRAQRPLPMSVAMICYIAAAIWLQHAKAPMWLPLFFYGAGIATAFATVISLRWKISAHTTAMGAFVGLIMWFAVDGLADVAAMIMLSISIILAGTVASCRILLARHTPAQTFAGLILGFVCTFCLTWFFYFF